MSFFYNPNMAAPVRPHYCLIGYPVVPEEVSFVPIPLETISTAISVRGFVAQIKATLVYQNKSDKTLQVQFQCPLDESSAVYHVEATLEERTIIGQCLEKKKAETIYKKAVSEGKTALLMREEQSTADMINLALGNLKPNNTVKITIGIVTELRIGSDGGVQFTLPTVLNPRYCPVDASSADAPVIADKGLYLKVPAPYTLNVSAKVQGSESIARIVSHTDSIEVDMDAEHLTAKISQSGGYTSDHDWSFVVYYNNPYKPQVLVESGDPTSSGLMRDQVLMVNLFPQLPENSYSNRNEVIFVVDRSGSMNGSKIENAKAVLLLFLKSLPPGCLFNVISFGSSYSLLFQGGSKLYSEETLAEALRLQKNMDAHMGGTEIFQPLKEIYSRPPNKEYARQILLLTDGEVWNVEQVTGLAARNVHNTRVFTVGIGDGASTALVKGLARAGGGRAEMVTERDRLQTKVMGLVASMLQASVQNVQVSCELDVPVRFSLIPPAPPVIFAGQHLTAYGRMPPGAVLKKLSINGSIEGSDWSCGVFTDSIKSIHDENKSLHRLAARAKILSCQDDDTEDVKSELIQLSTSSGVLCRFTSIIAVDQDGSVVPEEKYEQPVQAVRAQQDSSSFKIMKHCRRVPASNFSFGGSACLSQPPPRAMCAFAAKPSFPGNAMFGSASAAPVAPELCMVQQNESLNVMKDVFGRGRTLEDKSEEESLSIEGSREDDCELATDECDFGGIVEENKKDHITGENIMTSLIEKQSFNGSWSFENIILSLQIDEKDLECLKTNQSANDVAATALGIAALQMFFKDQASEWMLLESKAKDFIAKNLTDGSKQKVDEAVNLSMVFLTTLKDKYEHLSSLVTEGN